MKKNLNLKISFIAESTQKHYLTIKMKDKMMKGSPLLLEPTIQVSTGRDKIHLQKTIGNQKQLTANKKNAEDDSGLKKGKK